MVLGCLQVPLGSPKPSHPLIIAESLPPGVPKARLSPINEGEAGKGPCPPRRGGAPRCPKHPSSPSGPAASPPAEAKPQILGRFQVTPSKEPAAAAATSPAPGSSEGEQRGTELAASGSPLPDAPSTGSSSSSSSSSESEAAVQDPEVEEALPGEGAVVPAAAESEREGAGEEGAEGAPQAVLSQVWLSYSRSLSYVSSDDTESEDEEIWEELQSLRQK